MDKNTHSCTVLSLALIENANGEIAAFALARWLNRSCEALLVASPRDQNNYSDAPISNASRRKMEISERAQKAGIDASVTPLSFDAAVSSLKFSTNDHINILVQPAHPLERQTIGFRRLSAAAQESASAVIYAPPEPLSGSGDILVVAKSKEDPSYEFAQHLVPEHHVESVCFLQENSLREIETKLMERPPFERYDLLVLTRNGVSDQQTQLMRLAVMSGTPILVLEAEPAN